MQNLWLAARAEGIGVGWVSIIDPADLRAILALPPTVVPVAYLCLGHVAEFPDSPELAPPGVASIESNSNRRWSMKISGVLKHRLNKISDKLGRRVEE